MTAPPGGQAQRVNRAGRQHPRGAARPLGAATARVRAATGHDAISQAAPLWIHPE
jgi:hypothetical protein